MTARAEVPSIHANDAFLIPYIDAISNPHFKASTLADACKATAASSVATRRSTRIGW